MRLAPEQITPIGRAYYTSNDAADARGLHYAEVEGGYLGQAIHIAEAVFHEHRLRMKGSYIGHLSHLLSSGQIQKSVRNTRKGSAPGPDGISADLLRLMPEFTSKQLFPLHMKSTLGMVVPVQYRGGELYQRYKGKGDHALLRNNRSILLSDSVGKVGSKSRRASSLTEITGLLTDTNS